MGGASNLCAGRRRNEFLNIVSKTRYLLVSFLRLGSVLGERFTGNGFFDTVYKMTMSDKTLVEGELFHFSGKKWTIQFKC